MAQPLPPLTSTQPAPTENALKALASKLRDDSRRIAERVERAPGTTGMAPTIPTPATVQATAAVETAAHAAVAAAILPTPGVEDVTIRPMPTVKPSLFEPAHQEEPEMMHEPAPAPAFIPPQAERPLRQRMPRIDELPIPAQNEIRAQRGEPAVDNHPEKQRMSLMQRLASVGLGRRQEETDAAPPVPRAARPIPQYAPPPRPAPRQPEAGRPMDPVSEYGRRTAPQGLDPHGRPAPVHNSPEEDQLDIPAFLRRQAN